MAVPTENKEDQRVLDIVEQLPDRTCAIMRIFQMHQASAHGFYCSLLYDFHALFVVPLEVLEGISRGASGGRRS